MSYPPSNNTIESARFLAFTMEIDFHEIGPRKFEVSTPDGTVRLKFKSITEAKNAMNSDPRFHGFLGGDKRPLSVEAQHRINTPVRLPENVTGPFFVNSNCIDCDLCGEIAPSLFARNHDQGYRYVANQPGSNEAIRLMNEAISSCLFNDNLFSTLTTV